MKRCFAFALILTLALGLLPTVRAEAALYTEKALPLYRENEAAGTVTLRFYEDAPNVARIGLTAFARLMRGQLLTMEGDENVRVFTDAQGGQATVDIAAGVLTAEDWNAFLAPPTPLQGEPIGMLDSGCPFVRITDVTYGGPTVPVRFDLGRYGIALYGDEEDVYFPVSTLSNLLTDGATNTALYTGDALVLMRMPLDGQLPEPYVSSPTLDRLMSGEPRPDDVIRQSYADICLSFDTMFGYPGKSAFEPRLRDMGLERALRAEGPEGEALLDGLKSADYAEYLLAHAAIINQYLDDGHTQVFSVLSLLDTLLVLRHPLFMLRLSTAVLRLLIGGASMRIATLIESIAPVRERLWGADAYRKIGNIGVIRLDDFIPDEQGWAAYYAGEGSLPADAFGVTLQGLKTASEDPEIDTILFDLSANIGGSTDELMAVMSLVTDQRALSGVQVMSGQTVTFTFEIDRNLDGVFDEADERVRFPYRLAVLTSNASFSCGNLFPILMRENGAVILGEPSGGGSCVVQLQATQDGLLYTISSYMTRLTDQNGDTVETGCAVDLPIRRIENTSRNLFTGQTVTTLDYSAYFDDAALLDMINAWFENQANQAA